MVVIHSMKELKTVRVRPKKAALAAFTSLRRRISHKTRSWPASEVIIRHMRDSRYGSA